jgi:hypothetical protein
LVDEIFGFATVTPRDIVDHITTTYGSVSHDDLKENIKEMEAEWHSTQPLTDMWKQIRKARNFAANHNPISEETAILTATTLLENSGVFEQDLRDWSLLDEDQQTYANLKTRFNKADKERRKKLSSKQAGYSNLASDKPTTKPPPAPSNENHPPYFYCWTHGYGTNPNHTGRTCTNKAENHNPNATFYNMMGGNNRIHRVRNEKAIYKPPARFTNAGTANTQAPSTQA